MLKFIKKVDNLVRGKESGEYTLLEKDPEAQEELRKKALAAAFVAGKVDDMVADIKLEFDTYVPANILPESANVIYFRYSKLYQRQKLHSFVCDYIKKLIVEQDPIRQLAIKDVIVFYDRQRKEIDNILSNYEYQFRHISSAHLSDEMCYFVVESLHKDGKVNINSSLDDDVTKAYKTFKSIYRPKFKINQFNIYVLEVCMIYKFCFNRFRELHGKSIYVSEPNKVWKNIKRQVAIKSKTLRQALGRLDYNKKSKKNLIQEDNAEEECWGSLKELV